MAKHLMGFKKVPRTHFDSVVPPSVTGTLERLDELARLNPDSYRELLAEFGLAEPEGLYAYDDEHLSEFDVSLRERLDDERARVSQHGGLQLSAKATLDSAAIWARYNTPRKHIPIHQPVVA